MNTSGKKTKRVQDPPHKNQNKTRQQKDNMTNEGGPEAKDVAKDLKKELLEAGYKAGRRTSPCPSV